MENPFDQPLPEHDVELKPVSAQVILAGSLAFSILDRLTGPNWTVMNTDWGKEYIIDMFLTKEFAWFGVSLGFWMILAFVMMKFLKYLKGRALGWLTVKVCAQGRVRVGG